MSLKTKSTSLVLPKGVAGSSDEKSTAEVGTLSYDEATDTLRVKTTGGWADFSGGGGGGVTSFNGRTGVVTPQTGDYTPTNVGLGNVTDDEQLKRAAGDFSSFAQKTTPTTSDVVLIEDAAASGAKKYATVSSIITLASGVSTGNPYVDVPTSGHADNDEFTGFSGWTVWDSTANAVLTDDGDGSIDPWTFPAAGHFRRKTVGSYLLLQLPKSSNSVIVYKAITSASNMLWWSRWSYYTEMNSATPGAYAAFGIFPDSGSRPSASSPAMMVELGNIGSAGRKVVTNLASTRVYSNVQSMGVSPPGITGLFYASSTSTRAFVLSDNGDLQFDSGSPNTTSFTTPAYVGWRIQGHGSPGNASGMCPIFSVDYIRRKDSATAWVV